MKHVFIINPAAGKYDHTAEIIDRLKEFSNLDYQVFITDRPHAATEYIRKLCEENPEENYRFYACGGDGTLNEVCNGVYGHDNAAMTVYPVGSGNDFVKCVGGAPAYLDLKNLIDGEEMKIDVMKIADMYSINVISFGLDSVVVKTMEQVKRKPIIGGKNSYYTGALKAFFVGIKHRGKIFANGRQTNRNDTFTMCSLANGSHVGGSFMCAPRTVVNDGLMEVTTFNVIPRYLIPVLIGKYTRGEHLEDKTCLKYVDYVRSDRVKLEFPKETLISVDGELISGTDFTVEIIKEGMRFIMPKKC